MKLAGVEITYFVHFLRVDFYKGAMHNCTGMVSTTKLENHPDLMQKFLFWLKKKKCFNRAIEECGLSHLSRGFFASRIIILVNDTSFLFGVALC